MHELRLRNECAVGAVTTAVPEVRWTVRMAGFQRRRQRSGSIPRPLGVQAGIGRGRAATTPAALRTPTRTAVDWKSHCRYGHEDAIERKIERVGRAFV